MEPTATTGSQVKKGPSYTWDDFLALYDDDRRELIDGELIEVEVPTKLHEHIVGLIYFYLQAWTMKNGGLSLVSGYKVRISNTRGVMPDVQYYRPENPAAQTFEDTYDTPPDLAVEIISPSSRTTDRKKKLSWYAEIGVPEYWLIDPDARLLQRYILRDNVYVQADSAGGDDLFRPDTFTELEIPLAQLWTIAPASAQK